MATSANSAFMMWRQMSGDARPGQTTGLAAPRAQAQQADVRVGQSGAEALTNFANSATQLFGTAQKIRQDEATPKVKAWMSQHTMAEYTKKMREGNVPFQNDPVAMDVLHNQAAYNTALQVEEGIQAKIKTGAYKTIEEADEARTAALNGARAEYVKSMGISPDSKAFITGFDRDSDARRTALMNMQTDVTDKYLRTQAKVQTQADLLSPLTPDFVRAAPAKVISTYIGNTVGRAETLGQLRSDSDKLEVYQAAMQSLQGMPGGASAIDELGNQEVTLYGVKASLRTHLGGGTFDQAVLQARRTEQTQDAKRQGELHANLLNMQTNLDMNGLLALQSNLQAESGGKMTADLQAVQQTIGYVTRQQQAANAAMATQLQKDAEKAQRMTTGIQGLGQLITGQGLVSPDGKDLGFKDEAEAREGEERLLGSITDESQRLQVAMRLAAVRKDGFAANALKTWGDQATAAWGQFTNRINRGEQGVQVPEAVTRMSNLYGNNPEAFSMQFQDAPYIAALEAGKVIGAPIEDVARSQAEWSKLPKEVKKEAEDAVARQLRKITSNSPAYVEQSLRVVAAPLMTMGVPPETAVRLARESFDKQHQQYNGFPIHKGFFQVTGERESYEAGVAAFDKMLPEVKKSIGSPSDKNLAYWYDHTGQSVIVRNLMTGEASAPITRKNVQDAAVQAIKDEQAKTQLKVDKAVKQEDYKRRVQKARSDAGIFPGNRLEGDSGFSGAPKR